VDDGHWSHTSAIAIVGRAVDPVGVVVTPGVVVTTVAVLVVVVVVVAAVADVGIATIVVNMTLVHVLIDDLAGKQVWRTGTILRDGRARIRTGDATITVCQSMVHDTRRTTTSPAARTTDPATSHQAAAMPHMRDIHRTVLELLAAGPMTDFELAAATGLKQTSVGKRRGELAAKGLVADSGRRGVSDTGAAAIIWTATS
jgi:hypothetical protein